VSHLPAGTVLGGDFEPVQAKAWIEKYFGPIAAGPKVDRPDTSEPRQEEEKTATKMDALAKRPALAVGYHMPERGTQEYYAMGLIDQLLLQGDDSLLHEELVKRRAFTGGVSGGINLLGNMFDYDGPMLWMAYLFHDGTVKAQDVVQAMDTVIEPLRRSPVDAATLERALVKLRSSLYDQIEQFNGFGRANLLASFALFDDNPGRINDLETPFRKITPELIQKTASEYLRAGNRTVLVVETKTPEAPNKAGR